MSKLAAELTSLDLADLLDARLGTNPEQECLRAEGGTWWSRAEVAALAHETRAALDQVGVPGYARVAVVLGNSVEEAAAMLGVLLGRRVVTALNPYTPAERLVETLASAQPAALVVHAARAELACSIADQLKIPVVCVYRVGVTIESKHAVPVTEVYPDAAVELPTSGSTGTPKRVQLSASQLMSSFTSAGTRSRREDTAGPGGVLTVPLCHIGGLWGLLTAIASSSRTVLLDRFRVDSFVAALQDASPIAVGVPPAGIRMLLDAGLPRDALKPLKVVTAGSAPLDPQLADAFYSHFGVAVLPVYGATELAGAVAGWSLKDHRQWWSSKRGSVGRAFPGCRLRVVDEGGLDLGPAALGVLEVSSRQSADGEAGWTRTSDLARIDEDGFVFIEGRADDAIMRGGFKISPTAVRAALEAHPAVAEAVVVPRRDSRLGQVPVAVVEVRPGLTVSPDTLLAWCRTRLVPYEVPAEVRVVEALPRGGNMKVTQADVVAMLEIALP